MLLGEGFERMNFNTFYNKILTDENMMETIRHSTSAYPFRFYYDNLALFDFHCIEWHWHVEFELVYVENGTAVFSVGEKQVTLEAGQGFFVNSKVLHRFYSKEGAVIPNFVFVPTFIAPQSSLIYKKYVEPIEHSTLEGLTFFPEIPWQADILHVMEKIVQVQKEEKDDELKTSFLVQELWYLIYLHVEETKLEEKKEDFTSSQARLQLMMQYIHQHFGEKISLEDIAEQAVVSKSTALNLFRRYLHDTPVHYLLKYRLQESASLLVTTQKKVMVIAQNVGFENVDYFCKMFKKYYKKTPTEYREKHITKGLD